MSDSDIKAYELKPSLPNKLLNADGSITNLSGDIIEPANESRAKAYEYLKSSDVALPNKWLDSDGTIKTLSEIEGGSSIVGESIIITPSIEEQIITPSAGYNAITQATVEAVNATIDKNITTENIKKDVTILGVTGTAETVNNQDLEVTENGIYTADEGYTGFNEVVVNVTENSTERVSISYVGLFYNVSAEIQSLASNILAIITPSDTSAAKMFYKASITSLDLTNGDFTGITDISQMFYGCTKLALLDLTNFNTSNVTNMLEMFTRCSNLAELDVSNFDTSSVAEMGSMFGGCSSLTSLDLSNFSTSNVTEMLCMFSDCGNLTFLDVSSFDTSNVINMNSMFGNCGNLTSLDLSNFNTTNVTDMNYMFGGCSNLTSLDVSNFDISNVTDMGGMFGGCSGLVRLDLSNFVTYTYNPETEEGSTDVASMFENCTLLQTLDISGFDWRYTNDDCFLGCTSLEIVYVKDEDSKTACDTALSAAGLNIESTIKE